MARIVLASWMVRYPLGGNLSWALQWLVGFQRLGHDVYFVERSGYADSCFDPVRNTMSDDCSHGLAVVSRLLERHGLGERWCYLDADGTYHGMQKEQVARLFVATDVFIDMGAHGSWRVEAEPAPLSVLVEAEPGFTQIRMERRLAAGEPIDKYDHYFSVGQSIGTSLTTAPTGGRNWKTVLNPIVPDLFEPGHPAPGAPFTTVMNWRAHDPIEWQGEVLGQKDVEFEKFIGLPRLTREPLEIAVTGRDVPRERLLEHGWRLRDAHETTLTMDGYLSFIAASAGEFGVAKQVFVAPRTGWFSDRSAAYLASGRPVVLQDTGFSAHLPCGEGLFAVHDAESAAAAIEEIAADFPRHSAAARAIAREVLDARIVLPRMLEEIGVC